MKKDACENNLTSNEIDSNVNQLFFVYPILVLNDGNHCMPVLCEIPALSRKFASKNSR